MLNRIFLICSFFPFVSPYPIGSDIQPLAGVFAAIIIIRAAFARRAFSPKLVWILLIPFLLLGYNDVTASEITIDFGRFFSLIFGSLIFVGFYLSKESLTPRLFMFVVATYTAVTVLLLLFTSPMIELQNLLVRNTNSEDFGYRGVAALVTEPGLFGGLLIFFFLVTDYLFESGALRKNQMWAIYIMLMFMLVMTKSGTGYLYFLFYITFKFLLGDSRLIYKLLTTTISSLCLLASIYYISQIEGYSLGRGMSVLIQLSDPVALMRGDSSIMTRVVDVILGIISVFQYPLGVGNTASFEASYEIMMDNTFIYQFYASTGKEFGINSSFAHFTVAYGLIFWAYISYVFFFISKSSKSCKFFSFLYLSVSYSAAFPAIWILLALKLKRVDSVKNSGLRL